MASLNQSDSLESQVNALNIDFVTLSRRVEAIANQLQHLEKGSYAEAAIGKPAALHSLQKEQDNSISERVRALETASARTSTMLQDVVATSERLAQLAFSSEARVLKEMRNPATLPHGLTGYLVDAQDINKRLSILEDRLSLVADDVVTQSGSIANLHLEQSRNWDRFLPLEQSITALQSQIQNSDQKNVENPRTTLQQSPTQTEKQPPLAEPGSSQQQLRSVSAIEVQQATVNELEYEFTGSIWDLSLFIGTDLLDYSSSLVVGLCFLLNVALLTCFIDMCFSLSDSAFDEQSRDYFRMWRTTVAHNIEYRNRITGESLAHSVCTERLYTPIASYQLDTVQRLKDYLGDPPFLQFGVAKGLWMCCLSMCVWYMTLAVEMRAIFEISGAFATVKVGRQTSFERAQSEEKKHMVQLVKISRFRAAFLAVIIGIRFVTMVFLAYEGTLFLIYEISIEDMILNSVALQLMLNFDEMMFDSLVPNVPQKAIRMVVPLQRGRIQKGCRKTCNNSLSFFAMILLYVMYFVFFNLKYLQPFVDELGQNLNALCGEMHNLNFVVAVDSIGVPWAAPTPEADSVKETYAFKAISQVVETEFDATSLQPTQRSNTGYLMQVESGMRLERLTVDSPEFGYPKDWALVDPYALPEVVGWVDEFLVLGEHEDFGDAPGTVYNHYLQFLLAMSGIPVNCSHVPFEKCTTQGSAAQDLVYRQLCPNRCGCALPMTGTVSNPYSANSKYSFLGCSSWNLRKKTFVDALDSLPCTDTTSRDVFVSWAEGFGKSQDATGENMFSSIVYAFDYGGCDVVAKVKVGETEPSRVCAATSLPAICPFSCGCSRNASWTTSHTLRMDFCPSSCQRQQKPICVTIEKPHDIESGDRGPFAGFACVFPFVYKGKVYDSCTTNDWTGPWCSIAMMHGTSYRWGDCPNSSACI